MSLASNPPAPTASQATALTATVTPASATGVVTFFEGNSMLGSATLNGGVATLSVSALVVGSHSIMAVYNGDTNSNGSSASLTLTVTVGATTVTLTSSQNPAALGAAVTFTATVSPAAATGSVTFLDGTTSIGSGTLHAGKATVTVTTLSAGSHTVTANYSGDARDASSTSAALSETIAPNSSTTVLSARTYLLTFCDSVTLTATVSPATATGSVTFWEGPVSFAGEAVIGGQASVQIRPAAESHTYSATYNGDLDDSSSTSLHQTVTVSKAQSLTFVDSVYPTSSVTNPVPGPLFQATVVSACGNPPQNPTGYVVFSYIPAGGGAGVTLACNGIASGNVPVSNEGATCNSAPGLFPGPGYYWVGDTYSGDADYHGSTTLYTGYEISQTETP